jgi:hypothetical protein
MSDGNRTLVPGGPPPAQSKPPAARAGWAHFGIAAAVLLIVAVGWNAAAQMLHIALIKYPVPSAKADTQAHQLRNFPKEFGAFKEIGAAQALDEDILDELGTSKHADNWYHMARYQHTAGSGRAVQLSVTYYTGLLDAVPHTPDRCLVAAGSTVAPALCGEPVFTLDGVSGDWHQIKTTRTAYSTPYGGGAEYFFFSMNGVPTNSDKAVRENLILPWKKYCYFAKVQMQVLRPVGRDRNGETVYGPESDLPNSDRLIGEFLTAAMPKLLEFLPSSADVARLEAGR